MVSFYKAIATVNLSALWWCPMAPGRHRLGHSTRIDQIVISLVLIQASLCIPMPCRFNLDVPIIRLVKGDGLVILDLGPKAFSLFRVFKGHFIAPAAKYLMPCAAYSYSSSGECFHWQFKIQIHLPPNSIFLSGLNIVKD